MVANDARKWRGTPMDAVVFVERTMCWQRGAGEGSRRVDVRELLTLDLDDAAGVMQ